MADGHLPAGGLARHRGHIGTNVGNLPTQARPGRDGVRHPGNPLDSNAGRLAKYLIRNDSSGWNGPDRHVIQETSIGSGVCHAACHTVLRLGPGGPTNGP